MKVNDLASETYYDEQVKPEWAEYDVVVDPGTRDAREVQDKENFLWPTVCRWDHNRKLLVLEV